MLLKGIQNLSSLLLFFLWILERRQIEFLENNKVSDKEKTLKNYLNKYHTCNMSTQCMPSNSIYDENGGTFNCQ